MDLLVLILTRLSVSWFDVGEARPRDGIHETIHPEIEEEARRARSQQPEAVRRDRAGYLPKWRTVPRSFHSGMVLERIF